MNVLVTGVTGRIGRNFARAMIADGHTVRGLVIPDDPGLDGANADGVDVLIGNLRDPEAAAAAVAGMDAVMHLGAMMLWGSEAMNAILMEDNIRGTFNLVHAASEAKLSRFVFASSDEVYPSLGAKYLPIDENHPRLPYSFYGLTKVAGEELLQYYYRSSGLPIAIARFALVFEAWEASDPTGSLARFLFAASMREIAGGRGGAAAIEAFGDSGKPGSDELVLARDIDGRPYMFHCVDVRDIVQGLRLLLEREEAVGEAFNLSGPAPFSYGEVIPFLAEKTGRSYIDVKIPGPPIRIHHSTAKARALVGYQPAFDIFRSIEDGLANPR